MSIPTIETGRLVLRGQRLEDFQSYAALWGDPNATRHLGDGAVKSVEEAWTSFLRVAGHWQMVGFGNWIVADKSTGQFLGYIGFSLRRRERGLGFDDAPEVGWMFASIASGKGYATESLRAVLEAGRTLVGAVRIVAVVAPENAASMRVAEKCGFREFMRGESIGRPRVFFDRVL